MSSKSIEKYTKRMYDEFGAEYQKSREKHKAERAFNEFLEMPCMFKAIGNIRGKKLLDVGCGAGVHAKEYLRRGAKVWGMDVSKTMIELAKVRCKGAEFIVGSAEKLPYENKFFDIVTSSLCIDHVDNLDKAFREAGRVLKKAGELFFSCLSPIASAREYYEDENLRIRGLGYVVDKRTNKRIDLGNAFSEAITNYEMVPGMITKEHQRSFRIILKAIRQAGFELIDIIDCKPVQSFKKYNPEEYNIFTRIPIFSIYVCRKK